MQLGKTVTLNADGQRIDANGRPQPWREGSSQPCFTAFAAQHGGVFKAGSEVLKETGERVPHVKFKDGTEAWGTSSVKEAYDNAVQNNEKFSLLACSVGEYVMLADATAEDGTLVKKEMLTDNGEPMVRFSLFIDHIGEDENISWE